MLIEYIPEPYTHQVIPAAALLGAMAFLIISILNRNPPHYKIPLYLTQISITISSLLLAATAWNTSTDIHLYWLMINTTLVLLWYIISKHGQNKYELTSRDYIDNLDPYEFEEYVAAAMRRKGYRVKLTRKGPDYGADIIATKKRTRYLVEVKKQGRPIGSPIVQKALGALHHHKAQQAIVVSYSGFTFQALRVAQTGPVELWNIDQLL